MSGNSSSSRHLAPFEPPRIERVFFVGMVSALTGEGQPRRLLTGLPRTHSRHLLNVLAWRHPSNSARHPAS